MNLGITNISFAGRSNIIDKPVRKLEEAFVSASSNLKGTVNEVIAQRQLGKAIFAVDNDTFAGRVASFRVAKSPISDAPVSAAKSAPEVIIPEDSINFIC